MVFAALHFENSRRKTLIDAESRPESAWTSVIQRREVEADNIHLQFDSIGVLSHGAKNGILIFP